MTEDQRKVGLLVTEAGHAVLAKAPQPVDGILPQVLASMEMDALKNLKTSLELVVSKLDTKSGTMGNHPLADL